MNYIAIFMQVLSKLHHNENYVFFYFFDSEDIFQFHNYNNYHFT